MSANDEKSLKDQIDNLEAHLVMIKGMKGQQADDQFCTLCEKAQKVLGDTSPHVAYFYFEYASFLLEKFQKNMDIFNPGAVPNAGEEDFVDEYDELYDDDSVIGQNGANNGDEEKKEKIPDQSEKKERITEQKAENTKKTPQSPQKVVYEDDNVEIKQDDEKLRQKMSQNPDPQAQNGEEQQLTDLQICYQNLQAALNIYNRELGKYNQGETSQLDKDYLLKYKFMTHEKLGELYLHDQKQEQAIGEYRTAVKMADQIGTMKYIRASSEAYFQIANCLLYQNRPGCQKLAIQQFIESINRLIRFLQESEHYDVKKLPLPSLQNPRVDRFKYLNAPGDSETVTDLKEVISMILDKIEDTYEQISVRSVFEAEKAKINQQIQQSGFKEVPSDVKVTNLGTFGNRKKVPTQENPNANLTLNLTRPSVDAVNLLQNRNQSSQSSASKPNPFAIPANSANNPESSQKSQEQQSNQNDQSQQQKTQNPNINASEEKPASI